jgi:hypothetical protein
MSRQDDPITDVLKELAETANYLRDTGRMARAAVESLIAVEEDIVKLNRFLSLTVEHVDKAINAALRARDDDAGEPTS